MPISWKTLFLPKNFPSDQAIRNYVFGNNNTHMGLVLDYGSLLNHHESPNVQAGKAIPGSNKVHFQVRTGVQHFHRSAAKICGTHACMDTCTHTQQRHVHITNFQGHKKHSGWTGTVGSIWRRELVCKKRNTVRRC